MQIDFKKHPLVPVVVQHYQTKDVLILAYCNQEAYKKSIDTKLATFWSRSRNELWIKGATSGDKLKLHEVRINCKENSLLFLVEPLGGGVCHTKDETGKHRSTCFYRKTT